MFLRGLDTEKTWRVKDLPPPFKETTPMNSPKSQGHGAKTHPGAELQPVGIRWVCLNLTQSFCSSCFPPDPSAPHEALEPPILVPCDLNGIIHLSSPGWLELYLNIVENTTTLSAFSFFSLFLTILTLHPLQISLCLRLQAMLKSQIFFPLCDTTQTCSSLLIHQQTISVLCLCRTPLDPQMPPRPIRAGCWGSGPVKLWTFLLHPLQCQ